MEFDIEKTAQEVARMALTEAEYKGKKLVEWVERIVMLDDKEKSVPPCEEGDPDVLFCGVCLRWEYLYNEDGNRNRYCGKCGRRIDWSQYDAAVEQREALGNREERLPPHLQAAYDDLVLFLKGNGEEK